MSTKKKEENKGSLYLRIDDDILIPFKIMCLKKGWKMTEMVREYMQAVTETYRAEEKDHDSKN